MIQNIINSITAVEWVILIVVMMALIIAIISWRRAGRALQIHNKIPAVEIIQEEEPVQQEEQAAVLLEITADKNEFDQITLVLSNNGLLAARNVNISIDTPENIFDEESLSDGIEAANVTTSSVIIPKLAVLDPDNKLPVKEILPAKTIELPAALTMAHGKICDFPVSLKWKDEKGQSQHKQFTLTV